MARPNKTVATNQSVDAFLDGVEPEARREDARRVVELFRDATGAEPVMWGPSIIGFGRNDYRYDSGHGGTTAAIGLAPRKGKLVMYGLVQVHGAAAMLERLGRHSTGVGCLNIKRLSDVDEAVLMELARNAYAARNNA